MSSSGKSPSRHLRHDHSLGSVVADTRLIAQQVLQDGRSTRDRTTGGLCGLSDRSVSLILCLMLGIYLVDGLKRVLLGLHSVNSFVHIHQILDVAFMNLGNADRVVRFGVSRAT
jgi:hypothetical protein